ncbi:hypothetical protein F2Q70_00036375 [Brassica cretica]|uniref:Ubiquitin-like protease family profile domain-containing protein n=1 Tax=Brassica cretica TaxID=69181 RepID=A0A8S9K030_BRACR|nr:hypothetical protein F2Q70_00036375 [Brassica cretica]
MDPQTQIGPSKFDAELASRIMGPNEWLKNYDMDAMMYLFREKISLRRWKPNRVAFMNCMFSNQIITAYDKFDGNKRGYKVDNNLLEYGRGELPYHGSTGSVWSVDVDRLYIPICVNQIHWISMCVNLVNRTVEVFDCGGKKNNRAVEAFAVLIPRIAKAVQSSDKKKDFNVKQYTNSYVPMRALNKSGNYYGAYSLRFIECHLLGLDFSLVNDENIQEARHKIVFDLWEAANDEALQYRMSTFKPPKRAPEKTDPELSDVFGSLFDTLAVNLETPEHLQKIMGNLTQESHVNGFDPSQEKQSEEPSAFTTPMTSFRPEIFN